MYFPGKLYLFIAQVSNYVMVYVKHNLQEIGLRNLIP